MANDQHKSAESRAEQDKAVERHAGGGQRASSERPLGPGEKPPGSGEKPGDKGTLIPGYGYRPGPGEGHGHEHHRERPHHQPEARPHERPPLMEPSLKGELPPRPAEKPEAPHRPGGDRPTPTITDALAGTGSPLRPDLGKVADAITKTVESAEKKVDAVVGEVRKVYEGVAQTVRDADAAASENPVYRFVKAADGEMAGRPAPGHLPLPSAREIVDGVQAIGDVLSDDPERREAAGAWGDHQGDQYKKEYFLAAPQAVYTLQEDLRKGAGVGDAATHAVHEGAQYLPGHDGGVDIADGYKKVESGDVRGGLGQMAQGAHEMASDAARLAALLAGGVELGAGAGAAEAGVAARAAAGAGEAGAAARAAAGAGEAGGAARAAAGAGEAGAAARAGAAEGGAAARAGAAAGEQPRGGPIYGQVRRGPEVIDGRRPNASAGRRTEPGLGPGGQPEQKVRIPGNADPEAPTQRVGPGPAGTGPDTSPAQMPGSGAPTRPGVGGPAPASSPPSTVVEPGKSPAAQSVHPPDVTRAPGSKVDTKPGVGTPPAASPSSGPATQRSPGQAGDAPGASPSRPRPSSPHGGERPNL